MKIHILGICGTFMAGIATIARQQGHEVEGSDIAFYPPMSTQLADSGAKLYTGYESAHIAADVDIVIIGNVMSRGNKVVEYILEEGIAYTSGPKWLYDNVLKDRWVLAAAGTHGKTTTSSMLAWILEHAGLEPGFLIGGVPGNFNCSARLGRNPFFVIEADEYDTAFFDKQAKFVHYHPRTLILNNLEFDHADIYGDLAAIQDEFKKVLAVMPDKSRVVHPEGVRTLDHLFTLEAPVATAPYSDQQGDGWSYSSNAAGTEFSIFSGERLFSKVNWHCAGAYNVKNAVSAAIAAHHAGLDGEQIAAALNTFSLPKRRMEVRGIIRDVTVYDDFAHHPTAITAVIDGLQQRIAPTQRIIAAFELASFTVRKGCHGDTLGKALSGAETVFMFDATHENTFPLERWQKEFGTRFFFFNDIEAMITALTHELKAGDHVLGMSSRDFSGFHHQLLQALEVSNAVH